MSARERLNISWVHAEYISITRRGTCKQRSDARTPRRLPTRDVMTRSRASTWRARLPKQRAREPKQSPKKVTPPSFYCRMRVGYTRRPRDHNDERSCVSHLWDGRMIEWLNSRHVSRLSLTQNCTSVNARSLINPVLPIDSYFRVCDQFRAPASAWPRCRPGGSAPERITGRRMQRQLATSLETFLFSTRLISKSYRGF